MDPIGPSGNFAANNVIQNGDIDTQQFAELMIDCPYMMDLNGAKGKQDGEMEEQAIGYFVPMSKQLRFNLKLINNKKKESFLGLLQRCSIHKTNKNDKLIPTHTGMDGGSFHIPVEPLNEEFPLDTEAQFLKLYADIILQGEKLFITERYSKPIFRYFMDLDFVQPDSLTAYKVEVITFVVNRVVKRFWTTNTTDLFRLICCTTTWKQDKCDKCLCSCLQNKYSQPAPSCTHCHGVGCTGKNKLGKPCDKCKGVHPVRKKTGIHLIWPNLYVTDAICLDIRESIIAECMRTFGQRSEPFNNWYDVVDGSVYNQNGLRMIGSRKTEVCPACNRKDPKTCKLCIKYGGFGRVDTGRPYGPLFVTDGHGKRDLEKEKEYKNNYYQLILDTKIRSDRKEPTEGFTIPEDAPTYNTLSEKDKKRIDPSIKEGTKHKSPTRHSKVLLDTPEAEQLQTWFKSCPQPKYAELVISKIMKTSKAQNKYLVNVTGMNCTYCQNVGRCHKSNRIFFEVDVHGVSQRCHDTAEILDGDMKYGLCKDYKSAPMALSTNLRNLLFPSTEDENASILSEAKQVSSSSSKVSEIKIQSLLNAGNRLCRELYNVDWTTSARFASVNGDRLLEFQSTMFKHDRLFRSQKIYRAYVADAIGSKDMLQVIQQLGDFRPSTEEQEDVHVAIDPPLKKAKVTDADKLKEDKTTVVDIQEELHQIIKNIVNICLHSEETQVLYSLKEKGIQGILKGAKITKKKVSSSLSTLMQFD
jgi:hypothetical protein